MEKLAPDFTPSLNLDDEPLPSLAASFGDIYALTVVRESFQQAENFRTQSRNGDLRWNDQEALYLGFRKQRVWDGTTIPRSSLSIPIVFDQIQAALPAIDAAVFGGDPEWFEVLPEPGAQPQEARVIKDNLLYRFESDDFRKQFNLAAQSVLLYGNGGIEHYWDGKTVRNRYVDLKDFYFDPATPSSNIEDARYVIRRTKVTVDELETLRQTQGMKIPDKKILAYMADTTSGAFADRTKQQSEALRGVNYNPAYYDHTPLPSDRRIELLRYYDKKRVVWVLNRDVVIYNERNPYGFLPFSFGPCYIVPNRFYAQSFADVLDSTQRCIEALENARLDELSLTLNPPRVQQRGANSPFRGAIFPGQLQYVDNPKEMQVLAPQGATQNVIQEISYLEVLAEKRTGINSVGMGVPRPGNANRTASGMQMQVQGAASRMQYIVRNLEDYLLVPTIYKNYRMIQYHAQPEDLVEVLGPQNRIFQVGAEAFDRPVRFKINASSRMMTKEKLQQLFPFIVQYLMNGPFVEQLKQNGSVVDWNEVFQMMQDATGVGRKYTFVRPMNQQEQQAAAQPSPQEQQEMQKAQLDAQTRIQMGQMKADSEEKQRQVTLQLSDEETSRKMIELMIKQAMEQQKARASQNPEVEKAKIEGERQKTESKRVEMQQKLAFNEAQGRQKLQLEAQKAALQARQEQMKMQAAAQQTQQEMLINSARTQQELRLEQQRGEQGLLLERQRGEQGLDLERRGGEQKMKFEAARAKSAAQNAKLKAEASREKQKNSPRPRRRKE